jgi:hypothetical protein
MYRRSGVEQTMDARRASAAGHRPGVPTRPAAPEATGSSGIGAATGSRVTGPLAVVLGLAGIGLGVAALWFQWPFRGEWGLALGVSESLWITVGVPFSTMGALLFARRPGNRIGWLLLAGGLSSSGFHFGAGYFEYGQGLPGRLLAAWIAMWLWAVALVALMLLLLLYPTGRLVSRRWRPVAWAAGAWGILAVAVMAVSPVLGPGPEANPIRLRGAAGEFLVDSYGLIQSAGIATLALLLFTSLVSLVVRFRRSRGVERQQLKWLVYTASLAGVTTLVFPLYWLTAGLLSWLSVWAIPVAIGLAVLRYRLYDIDRLINRTLVYGLLTATLGLGYLAMVYLLNTLVLGNVLNPGNRQSSLAVAASTLAVAAVFQPARRRIQNLVDRRFNRARYDAAKTIEAFSLRLRDQVDLDTLNRELLAAVDQTVEPMSVSLWLRPQIAPHRQPAAARHREPG